MKKTVQLYIIAMVLFAIGLTLAIIGTCYGSYVESIWLVIVGITLLVAFEVIQVIATIKFCKTYR